MRTQLKRASEVTTDMRTREPTPLGNRHTRVLFVLPQR
jgi:hypothetical protein